MSKYLLQIVRKLGNQHKTKWKQFCRTPCMFEIYGFVVGNYWFGISLHFIWLRGGQIKSLRLIILISIFKPSLICRVRAIYLQFSFLFTKLLLGFCTLPLTARLALCLQKVFPHLCLDLQYKVMSNEKIIMTMYLFNFSFIYFIEA